MASADLSHVPTSLRLEIVRFLRQPEIKAYELWTTTGCDGKCDLITSKFLDFIGEGDVVECQGWEISDKMRRKIQPNADTWHILAHVEGYFIDFTRKQFSPKAEFPHVSLDMSPWHEFYIHKVPQDCRPIVVNGVTWKNYEPIWLFEEHDADAC